MLLESSARVCLWEANTPRKNLLQRPASLEIADLPGLDRISSTLVSINSYRDNRPPSTPVARNAFAAFA
jgi:hypothetical protein